MTSWQPSICSVPSNSHFNKCHFLSALPHVLATTQMNPERIRNVLSDWFIHILFYFSLRNYSFKKINNLLWLRGEVSVLQWCILISQIRLPSASCCWFFLSFLVPAAWVNGDPRRVAYPTDSQGYFCGQKGTPNEWVWPLCFVWFYCLSWNLEITFALILLIRGLKFIKKDFPPLFPRDSF